MALREPSIPDGLAFVRGSGHRRGLGPGVEAVELDTMGWTTWGEMTATDEQVAYVEACAGRLRELPLGACFANIQQLVSWTDFGRRLRYAEGIGTDDIGLPALHAWAILDGALVVDVTWRRHDDGSFVIGEWAPEHRVYRGRVFDLGDVQASMEMTGQWTSLLSPEPR